MKKVLKKSLKYSIKAMIGLFIVFVLFLGSLFFREQKLPRFVVDGIAEKYSTENFRLDCENAYFSFRYGLRLFNISLYDKRKEDAFSDPVARVKTVHYEFSKKTLSLDKLEYERLSDSYYNPVDDGSPDEAPLDFEIPDIPVTTIVMTSPSILGLKPDKVVLNVNMIPKMGCIAFNDLEIVSPSRSGDTVLRGSALMDLRSQKFTSHLKGSATQRQIRPLIETLDVRCALPYMDAFTDIPVPVKCDAFFDVDLLAGDFAMKLKLDVEKMGRYNSVPMAYAKGGIDFKSKNIDGRRNVVTKITVSDSEDCEGRKMAGWVTVDDFSGKFKVGYDCKTELKIEDALKIADFMEPSTFDFVRFDSDSSITVNGFTGTSAEALEFNNLEGEARAKSGSFSGFRFSNLNGRYSLKKDVVSLEAEMTGADGGKVNFSGFVGCEKFEDGKAHFALKGSYRNGTLKEWADTLRFDLGERKGNVDIDLDISGVAATNMWNTVNGSGSIRITEGHLARVKVFSGLTELLAEKVPGISFLVDQTQAFADFKFDNGVVSTENLYIEGGLVSIKGWGGYDIANDNLDFVVRVQFMKRESIAGKAVHLLTFPVTKTLLEFKVSGSIDDPKWENIQITDRIF